jgi:hypothetical protein
MMTTIAAVRRLPIAMMLGLLAACGEQPEPARPVIAASSPKSEIDEVQALIAATKEHPSLVNPAKDAGRPIHVDPLPKSGGGTAGHDHHASK